MNVFPIPVPVIFMEVVPLSLQIVADDDGDVNCAVDDVDYLDFDGCSSSTSSPIPVLTNFSVHQYLLRCQTNEDYDDVALATGRQRRERRHIRPRPWYVNFRSNFDSSITSHKNNKTEDPPIIEDEKFQDKHQQQIMSGYLQLENDNKYKHDAYQDKKLHQPEPDHELSGLLPIVWIPSDDPLQIRPVPCIVKAYVHLNHFSNDHLISPSSSSSPYILPATIAPSTLVRIMTPSPALSSLPSPPSSPFRSSPPQPSWIERLNFLNNGLLGEGESPDNSPNNNNDDIIRCYDAHVVDELTLKIRRVASRTIQIGTTQDALINYRRQRIQLDRLRRCCKNHFQSPENKNHNTESATSSSNTPPSPRAQSWWWPPSLIVHSQNNCDGKTLLVQTILRQRLNCGRVHTIRAGPILAKYGIRADAALESQIHTAIVGAACHHHSKNPNSSIRSSSEPPLCAIILDQMELFLPPRLSGKTSDSGGDSSVAVVNAIASYLRSITLTMQRYSEFPFPVKNPLYNSSNSLSSNGGEGGGQVLPVRICLIGIVTCPDDGWRASSQMTASSSSGGGTVGLDGGGSIFNSMGVGGDIFRLPLLTDLGRFLALKSFFTSRGLQLYDDDAVAKLEAFAGSCQWIKAGVFQKLASRLVQIVDKKESKTTLIETEDLAEAFESVRLDRLGISRTPSSSIIGNVDESADATAKENQISHFGSVGGAVKAKAALEDALALDPRKRKLLKQFGLRPPSGVLLYGPPGTGKTLLAKAVAELLYQGVNNNRRGSPPSRSPIGRGGKFISLNISDVVSSEVGTSEKTLVTTFEYADQNAPAVIFLDEFQALFTDRNSGGSGRLTTTLLQCLDDIHRWHEADEDAKHEQQNRTETDNISRVTVIAATNTPWMIDTAFLRSGRFDRVVQVGLPTLSERESIFIVHARRMRIQIEYLNDKDHGADVRGANLQSLARFVANETDGYSGADIAALCRAAAVRALISEGPNAYVIEDHFSMALSSGEVCASSDAELILRLESWRPGRTMAR
mmetsp:Transcript_1067/g.2333  ORF Transcript_1067/g.2333 Transcript_1067/m.2333 type:complete len:1023 (+) Transcript_1067:75-3143(+)